VASALVQPEDIERLIAQIVSMREVLSDVVGSLRTSRRELEANWFGRSAPPRIEAELAGIERSIAENADALDRLAATLKHVRAIYEEADAEIRRTLDV
jgi:uncharacterized protein YukE